MLNSELIKYRIVSDSMMPLIPVGAEIKVQELRDISNLKKFEILLFKDNDRLMCHYFWHQNKKFDKGNIITRALKTGDKDLPFNKNKIVGVVTNFKISRWLEIKILLQDWFFIRK